jgi:hypothetical protein
MFDPLPSFGQPFYEQVALGLCSSQEFVRHQLYLGQDSDLTEGVGCIYIEPVGESPSTKAK